MQPPRAEALPVHVAQAFVLILASEGLRNVDWKALAARRLRGRQGVPVKIKAAAP